MLLNINDEENDIRDNNENINQSSKVDTSSRKKNTSSKGDTTSSKFDTSSREDGTTSGKVDTSSSECDTTISKSGTTSSIVDTSSNKGDTTSSKSDTTNVKVDTSSSKGVTTSSKGDPSSSKRDVTSCKDATTGNKSNTSTKKKNRKRSNSTTTNKTTVSKQVVDNKIENVKQIDDYEEKVDFKGKCENEKVFEKGKHKKSKELENVKNNENKEISVEKKPVKLEMIKNDDESVNTELLIEEEEESKFENVEENTEIPFKRKPLNLEESEREEKSEKYKNSKSEIDKSKMKNISKENKFNKSQKSQNNLEEKEMNEIEVCEKNCKKVETETKIISIQNNKGFTVVDEETWENTTQYKESKETKNDNNEEHKNETRETEEHVNDNKTKKYKKGKGKKKEICVLNDSGNSKNQNQKNVETRIDQEEVYTKQKIDNKEESREAEVIEMLHENSEENQKEIKCNISILKETTQENLEISKNLETKEKISFKVNEIQENDNKRMKEDEIETENIIQSNTNEMEEETEGNDGVIEKANESKKIENINEPIDDLGNKLEYNVNKLDQSKNSNKISRKQKKNIKVITTTSQKMIQNKELNKGEKQPETEIYSNKKVKGNEKKEESRKEEKQSVLEIDKNERDKVNTIQEEGDKVEKQIEQETSNNEKDKENKKNKQNERDKENTIQEKGNKIEKQLEQETCINKKDKENKINKKSEREKENTITEKGNKIEKPLEQETCNIKKENEKNKNKESDKREKANKHIPETTNPENKPQNEIINNESNKTNTIDTNNKLNVTNSMKDEFKIEEITKFENKQLTINEENISSSSLNSSNETSKSNKIDNKPQQQNTNSNNEKNKKRNERKNQQKMRKNDQNNGCVKSNNLAENDTNEKATKNQSIKEKHEITEENNGNGVKITKTEVEEKIETGEKKEVNNEENKNLKIENDEQTKEKTVIENTNKEIEKREVKNPSTKNAENIKNEKDTRENEKTSQIINEEILTEKEKDEKTLESEIKEELMKNENTSENTLNSKSLNLQDKKTVEKEITKVETSESTKKDKNENKKKRRIRSKSNKKNKLETKTDDENTNLGSKTEEKGLQNIKTEETTNKKEVIQISNEEVVKDNNEEKTINKENITNSNVEEVTKNNDEEETTNRAENIIKNNIKEEKINIEEDIVKKNKEKIKNNQKMAKSSNENIAKNENEKDNIEVIRKNDQKLIKENEPITEKENELQETQQLTIKTNEENEKNLNEEIKNNEITKEISEEVKKSSNELKSNEILEEKDRKEVKNNFFEESISEPELQKEIKEKDNKNIIEDTTLEYPKNNTNIIKNEKIVENSRKLEINSNYTSKDIKNEEKIKTPKNPNQTKPKNDTKMKNQEDNKLSKSLDEILPKRKNLNKNENLNSKNKSNEINVSRRVSANDPKLTELEEALEKISQKPSKCIDTKKEEINENLSNIESFNNIELKDETKCKKRKKSLIENSKVNEEKIDKDNNLEELKIPENPALVNNTKIKTESEKSKNPENEENQSKLIKNDNLKKELKDIKGNENRKKLQRGNNVVYESYENVPDSENVSNWLSKQPTVIHQSRKGSHEIVRSKNTIDCRLRRSSEGISPEQVVLEAKLSGIFGSVMSKHYKNIESNDDVDTSSSPFDDKLSLNENIASIFKKRKSSSSSSSSEYYVTSSGEVIKDRKSISNQDDDDIIDLNEISNSEPKYEIWFTESKGNSSADQKFSSDKNVKNNLEEIEESLKDIEVHFTASNDRESINEIIENLETKEKAVYLIEKQLKQLELDDDEITLLRDELENVKMKIQNLVKTLKSYLEESQYEEEKTQRNIKLMKYMQEIQAIEEWIKYIQNLLQKSRDEVIFKETLIKLDENLNQVELIENMCEEFNEIQPSTEKLKFQLLSTRDEILKHLESIEADLLNSKIDEDKQTENPELKIEELNAELNVMNSETADNFSNDENVSIFPTENITVMITEKFNEPVFTAVEDQLDINEQTTSIEDIEISKEINVIEIPTVIESEISIVDRGVNTDEINREDKSVASDDLIIREDKSVASDDLIIREDKSVASDDLIIREDKSVASDDLIVREDKFVTAEDLSISGEKSLPSEDLITREDKSVTSEDLIIKEDKATGHDTTCVNSQSTQYEEMLPQNPKQASSVASSVESSIDSKADIETPELTNYNEHLKNLTIKFSTINNNLKKCNYLILKPIYSLEQITQIEAVNLGKNENEVNFLHFANTALCYIQDIHSFISNLKTMQSSYTLDQLLSTLQATKELLQNFDVNSLNTNEIKGKMAQKFDEHVSKVMELLHEYSAYVSRIIQLDVNDVEKDCIDWSDNISLINQTSKSIYDLNNNLQNLTSNFDFKTEASLKLLQDMKRSNDELISEQTSIVMKMKKLIIKYPFLEIPLDLYKAKKMSFVMEKRIENRESSFLDEGALNEETYEKFVNIMKTCNKKKVFFVSSFENLEDVIKDYKKFISNLYNCEGVLKLRSINKDEEFLEKLEKFMENLMEIYQKLLIAKSRWILIEEKMEKENDWLIEMKKLLTNVTYDDDSQIKCIQSSDIDQRVAHVKYLTDISHNLSDNVKNLTLENKFDQSHFEFGLFKIHLTQHLNTIDTDRKLREEYDKRYEKFNTWLIETEDKISKSSQEENVNNFWKLRTEMEVFDDLLKKICSNQLTSKFDKIDCNKSEKHEELQKRFKSIQQNIMKMKNESIKDMNEEYDEMLKEFEKNAVEKDLQTCYLEVMENIATNFIKPNESNEILFKIRNAKFLLQKEEKKCSKNYFQIINEISKEHEKLRIFLDKIEKNDYFQESDLIFAVEKCKVMKIRLTTQENDLKEMCEHDKCNNLDTLKNDCITLQEKCSSILKILEDEMNIWQEFNENMDNIKKEIVKMDFFVESFSKIRDVSFEGLTLGFNFLQNLNNSLTETDHWLPSSLLVSNLCQRNSEIVTDLTNSHTHAISCWTEKRNSLNELCEKYKKVLEGYARYEKCNEFVNAWIDGNLCFIIESDESSEIIHMYENILKDRNEAIQEFKFLLSELDVNLGNSFLNHEMDEKLSHVTSIIEEVKNIKNKHNFENQIMSERISENNDLINNANEEMDFCENNQDNIKRLMILNEQLKQITNTDRNLNDIKTEHADLLCDESDVALHYDNSSVRDLITNWQQVFKKTFQEYHRLFSQIITEQDNSEILVLWKEHLNSIQSFLSTEIPDEYHSLSEDSQLCQLYESLLYSQQSELMKDEITSRMDQFDSLTKLHDDTLTKILTRNNKINVKLLMWNKYRKNHKEILLSLSRIENERCSLKLQYVKVDNVDSLIGQIKNLLEKSTQVTEEKDNLEIFEKELLNYCDKPVSSCIKIDLDAISQRISNLQAALSTWLEYLENIRRNINWIDESKTPIREIFNHVHKTIDEEQCREMTINSKEEIEIRLERIKELQEELTGMEEELEKLSDSVEELSNSLDPKDGKKKRLELKQLKQEYANHKHLLSQVIYDLTDKLSIIMKFDERADALSSWINDFDKRLDTLDIKDDNIEFYVRKLKNVFITERDLKSHDVDCTLDIALSLINDGNINGKAPWFAKNIVEKIQYIKEIWKNLNWKLSMKLQGAENLQKKIEGAKYSLIAINTWIYEMEEKIMNRRIEFTNASKEELESHLRDNQKLQDSIEVYEDNVNKIVGDCEEFLEIFDNNSLDMGFILMTDSIKKRYQSLLVSCCERKEKIMKTWQIIGDLIRKCEDQQTWIRNQYSKLNEIKEITKKAGYSNLSSLHEDTVELLNVTRQYYENFNLMDDMYKTLLSNNDIKPMLVVNEAKESYTILRNTIKEFEDNLKCLLIDWQEFTCKHENIILTLIQIDARLTQIKHLKNDVEMQKKIQEIEILQKETKDYKSQIDVANELSQKIISNNLIINDEFSITEKVKEYKNLYKQVLQYITSLLDYYSHYEEKKMTDEEVQVETLKFEEDFESQVNTLPSQAERIDTLSCDLKTTYNECKKDLELLKKIMESKNDDNDDDSSYGLGTLLAKCRCNLDLMRHLCAILINQCGMPTDECIIKNVEDLGNAFCSISQQLTTTDNNDLMTCPLCGCQCVNFVLLEADAWRLEQWLSSAEGILKSNPTKPPDDMELLQDAIIQHQELMTYKDSHEGIACNIEIMANHMLRNHENEQDEFKDKIVSVWNKWKVVHSLSISWHRKLRDELMKNEQYYKSIRKLMECIENLESELKSSQPINKDKDDLRALYKKLRKLNKEIKRLEPIIASLELMTNFCVNNNNDGAEDEELWNEIISMKRRIDWLKKVTSMNIMKLATVLEVTDVDDIMSSGHVSLQSLSDELLDGTCEMKQSSEADASESNEDTKASPRRFVRRFLKVSFPLQVAMIVLLAAAFLNPFSTRSDEVTCSTMNNFRWSFQPSLHHIGRPPI